MREITIQKLFGAILIIGGAALFFAGFTYRTMQDPRPEAQLGSQFQTANHWQMNSPSYPPQSQAYVPQQPTYPSQPQPQAYPSQRPAQVRMETAPTASRLAGRPDFAPQTSMGQGNTGFPAFQKLPVRNPAYRAPSRASAPRDSNTAPDLGPVLLEEARNENRNQRSGIAHSVLNVQQASFESEVDLELAPLEQPTLEASSVIDQSHLSDSDVVPAQQPTAARSLQQTVLPKLRTSAQIEARARERLEYGESLIRRKSLFAAREEFVLALITIARSYRTESNPGVYADRLAQGLTALEEANDFIVSRSMHKAHSHKTQLLSAADIASVSTSRAMDLYCGFAQSQIEQAIGHSPAGSEALHALGKLESRLPQANSSRSETSQTRALVFMRAALSVNPANALCSNDLGVLLYNMGRLAEAEEALKVSLGSSQTGLSWHNLASVHSEMASAATGQERERQLWLAKLAAVEVQKFAGGPPRGGFAGNQWATVTEFRNNAAFPETAVEQASNSPRNANVQQPPRSATLLEKAKGWY